MNVEGREKAIRFSLPAITPFRLGGHRYGERNHYHPRSVNHKLSGDTHSIPFIPTLSQSVQFNGDIEVGHTPKNYYAPGDI